MSSSSITLPVLVVLSAVLASAVAELDFDIAAISRELSARAISPFNPIHLSLQTERQRKPIKCKDNKGCKKWLKRRFCADRRFNAGTKALLCPVACGFCDFQKKKPSPFPFLELPKGLFGPSKIPFPMEE